MTSRWREMLLAAAGFVGLAAALWSALGSPVPRGDRSQVDVAAVVDGIAISRLDFERAVAAVSGDRREPLGRTDRERILDTLITEELLVARALELDLVRADNALRKAAVQASLRTAGAGAADEPPTDEDLRGLYDGNPTLFSPSPRIRVRHVRLASEQQAARLASAVKGGRDLAQAVRAEGGTWDAAVPNRLLEATKLSDYLPARLAQTAERLPAGTVAGPFAVARGHSILWVVEREDPSRRSFEDVKPALADIWQRRRDEARAAAMVDRLRARADVDIVVDLEP